MIRILSTLFVVLIFFNGCSIIKESEDSFKLKYFHSTSTTNFKSLTEDLLDQICPTIKSMTKKRNKPFYVVDFVNIKDLNNHSELGFLLSDELKTLVTQKCNRTVYSIEYTKYIKIGENGTDALSRDLDELSQTKINKNTHALVGTYAITQRQLILYLKLVDLRTGVILKAATQRATLTDEIMNFEKKDSKQQNPYTQVYRPISL
jgi:PBP1b-binding outer membrane lipoprotein LpoB